MIRYQSSRAPDTALRTQLRDLANERKRFGYRRLFVLLRQAGEPSGINRIYRLYREEGLTVRKRRARRRAVGTRTPSLSRRSPMPDGRSTLCTTSLLAARFRILNIVDDESRPRKSVQTIGGVSADGGHAVARESGETMQRRPRRNHTPAFKAKVALVPSRRANVGSTCGAVRCSSQSDHAMEIAASGRAAGVFGSAAGTGTNPPAVDVKSLHAKIGELTLENDFLEVALTKAGLLSARR